MPKQTIIANPCLADTSFLSNFVFTGNAALLMQVLNSPIYLTPVVLDPSEQLGSTFLEEPPQSELLKPLYIARKQANSKYVDAELPLQSFITGHNTLWKAIEVGLLCKAPRYQRISQLPL